jgi:TolA-binding protein
MVEKITRKDIRHDIRHDKFVEEVNSFYDTMRENATRFIGAVIVLLALFGIAYAVYAYRSHQESVAQKQLALAIDIMISPVGAQQPGAPASKYRTEAEKIAKAQPILAEVAKKRGTDAADIAELYIASLAAQKGDVAGAQKRLEAFIKDHPKSILAGSARMSLYDLKLASGDPKDVIFDLERELKNEKSTLPKDAILAELAKAYQKTGDEAKARETYQRIITEFPDSAFASDAQRRFPATS